MGSGRANTSASAPVVPECLENGSPALLFWELAETITHMEQGKQKVSETQPQARRH